MLTSGYPHLVTQSKLTFKLSYADFGANKLKLNRMKYKEMIVFQKWTNLFMLSLSMVPIHICGNVDAINIPTYIYLYLATVRFIHVCITKKWEVFQSCILR